MPGARELRLELGCGKGRFTAETARQNPDILFIAIEKVPDALVVAMERAMALELKNVFFVVGDAALLPDYFTPEEVDLIYIALPVAILQCGCVTGLGNHNFFIVRPGDI